MTSYGYIRVNPNVAAGTLNMQGWWMRWHGCDEVYGDVWIGPKQPPAFDLLLTSVLPGDLVRVPLLAVFGPTDRHVAGARERLRWRGAGVMAIGEAPPTFYDGHPYVTLDAAVHMAA
jgi:hypothetical protein